MSEEAAGSVARLRPSARELVDAAAVLLLVLAALWAFRSSFGGVRFMIVGGVAALVAILLVHLASRLRLHWLVTGLLAVPVYAVTASVLALGYQCIGGVIPTPRSLLNALTSAATAWKELLTTAPPVGAIGDLQVIPVFVGFAAALLSYGIARGFRYTAPALVPPLVVLALGIAVGTNKPVSVVVHGAVLTTGMLAWLAWREHHRRPLLEGLTGDRRRLVSGALVLGVAGVAGYFAAPSLPGSAAESEREIWRQTVVPPFDPRDYPSPLAGYRDYVKLGYVSDGEREPDKVMFTVEGLPEGVPLRLATMDAYDGLVWQVSGGDPANPSLQDSCSFERVGASVPADFDGVVAEVTVTIQAYADVWVPDVGEVVSLRFSGSEGGPARDRALAESFRYNRTTDTAASPLRLQAGDRYVMTVHLPPETPEQMSGQTIDADVPRIGATAPVSQLTQAIGTADLLVLHDTGERLDQVKELFTKTGAYSDGDIQANQIQARAGHSNSRMVEFGGRFPTVPFVGNAEQYAAAYALLFRDLDHVPTRVVMGFVPDEASLAGPVEVKQTDVEAWVEVPVKGVGWVAIFPTPDRQQTAASSTAPQQPEPDYRTQNPPPPPLVDPEFDQPAKASGDAKPLEEGAEEPPQPQQPGENPIAKVVSSPYFVGGAIAVSPFVLALLAGLAVIVIKVLRRRRRRSRGAAHQRISNGWLEVTDLATDLGRPVPPLTTRREAAAFVGGSAVELAERTDAKVWGGQDLSDAEVDAYWADLTSALAAMKSEVGPIARIRAAMSPRSLRRQKSSFGGGRK